MAEVFGEQPCAAAANGGLGDQGIEPAQLLTDRQLVGTNDSRLQALWLAAPTVSKPSGGSGLRLRASTQRLRESRTREFTEVFSRRAASLARRSKEPTRDRVGFAVDYSLVSLWEMAIKASLGREDFQVDPSALRRGLLREGFQELPIEVEHVLAVRHLPLIHRDPFDRLLVAQALQEHLRLLTTNKTLMGYGEAVQWAG